MRTEYYGVGVYTAESCTIGFPWIFTINNNARWGNHEGPQEVQLAVSRDLFHWERPFRTPVIPLTDVGQWDCCYQATGNRALRVGDEIRVYYDGATYTHGTPALYRAKFEDGRPTGRDRFTASIGLATWPLDRFVSVDAGPEQGTLMTVPISFQRLPSGDQCPDKLSWKDPGADTGRGRTTNPRDWDPPDPSRVILCVRSFPSQDGPEPVPVGRPTRRPPLPAQECLALQFRLSSG